MTSYEHDSRKTCSWSGLYGWACGNSSKPDFCIDANGVAVSNSYSAYPFGADTVKQETNVNLYHNVEKNENGDVLAIYLHNASNAAYKPYAIRAVNYASTPMVLDTAGVNRVATPGVVTWELDTWPADGFPKVLDFSTLLAS